MIMYFGRSKCEASEGHGVIPEIWIFQELPTTLLFSELVRRTIMF